MFDSPPPLLSVEEYFIRTRLPASDTDPNAEGPPEKSLVSRKPGVLRGVPGVWSSLPATVDAIEVFRLRFTLALKARRHFTTVPVPPKSLGGGEGREAGRASVSVSVACHKQYASTS